MSCWPVKWGFHQCTVPGALSICIFVQLRYIFFNNLEIFSWDAAPDFLNAHLFVFQNSAHLPCVIPDSYPKSRMMNCSGLSLFIPALKAPSADTLLMEF
jgi:hypothetical protein